MPASGGVPVQITALDPARQETGQFGPSFLPDGRHFVYIRASTDEGKSAIYLGSVDAKPEQQSSKPLVASNSQPVYAPSADPSTGYLLFIREGTLMAQPFDNRRLELKGQAAPVAEQVGRYIGGAGYGAFSASANDVLVFLRSRSVNAAAHLVRPGGQGFGNRRGAGLLSTTWRFRRMGRGGPGEEERGPASNIWLLDLSRRHEHAVYVWFGGRQ